jgi:hypothetical protein
MKNLFLTALLVTNSCGVIDSPVTSTSIRFYSVAHVTVPTLEGELCGTAAPIYQKNDICKFLTCWHVVGKPTGDIILRIFSDGELVDTVVAEVIASDSKLDLAVLSCKTKAILCFPSITRSPIRNNDMCITLSCPLGEDPIFSEGRVSIRSNQAVSSANAAPGSSGGGIYDANTGELLGISRAIFRTSQFEYHHMNLFTPATAILPWLERMKIV